MELSMKKACEGLTDMLAWLQQSIDGIDRLTRELPPTPCPDCEEPHIHPVVDTLLPCRYIMVQINNSVSMTMRIIAANAEQIQKPGMIGGVTSCIEGMMEALEHMQRLLQVSCSWLDEAGIKLQDYVEPPPLTAFGVDNINDDWMMASGHVH